jgi:cleavage and polyadenylation specificity factor subunit 2
VADELGLENDADGADAGASSEEDLDDQKFEGPAKAVYEKEAVTVNARLAYVDFMGLHDKRSLEMLIPLIQPRKLILVGGMKEDTSALATECRKLLNVRPDGEAPSADSAAIFTPTNGEIIDASVDTNAWMVKLSNNLVKRLQWQHVRALGVVALTAQLRGPEITYEDDESAESANKKLKLLKDESSSGAVSTLDGSKPAAEKSDVFPMLDTLPANMAAGTRSMARPLHVGDLRLADLRRIMQGTGHAAEFRGEGTLLIDGQVAVRKSGTGKIEIEAAAQSNQAAGRGAGSFLAVKRKIYEGLAVVAGG